MSSIANPITSLYPGSTAASIAAPAKPASDALTSKDTFLKLLVAQIKNQDPTNPTDSTQFVGQLTQYSELEQLIGINQGVGKLQSPTVIPPVTNPPVTVTPPAQ